MRRWTGVLLYGMTGLAFAQASAVLPLPPTPPDGQTVALACGRQYSGTLDLSGRRDITVRTVGDCGKATITPAVPVGGWHRDLRQSQIWLALLTHAPTQLALQERTLALAHHPNAPEGWLRGSSTTVNQLRAELPHNDLNNATVVWRAADWLIQSRALLRYENGVLYLAPGDDEGFGLLPETAFYVEGKRWMLDSPGEWAWEHGVLAVWPPDGRSPEGRAWASPSAMAINARHSERVTIEDVRIVGATLAIDGSASRDLVVSDTEILNSDEAAIVLGGRGARIARVTVRGTVKHGLRAEDDARDVSITDSRFEQIGMLGMPKRSKGAIVFEQASGHRILRNRIHQSAYLGIRAFRDAHVEGNVISGACLRLSDCGGIYFYARDRQPLHSLVANNRISGLQGRHAYAIYLDDFANGVTVRSNLLLHNPGGLQLHNAFDNLIERNQVVGSTQEHVLFNETARVPAIRNNRIRLNHFVSATEAPVYRLWSHHGNATVRDFARFEGNRYVSAGARFAEVEGVGMLNVKNWRAWRGVEPGARYLTARTLPELAGQGEQK